MISQQVDAMDLYSASTEDLETTFYFLDLHEIKLSPRNKLYPVTNFLISGQPTQSESQKAFNWKSD